MKRVFILLNCAFINIFFVNIHSDVRISVVDQVLKLSLNETSKLDALFFRGLFRKGRITHFNLLQGNSSNLLEETQKIGKLQKQFSDNEPFFCDVNGPGRRSPSIPLTVHRLTPGDIDIVGAIGDSVTAGNGALAIKRQQIYIEFKGLSWAIGGQGTWRQFLTLPNILKEFNPKLYGYSVESGFSFQKLSRFNVAEFGAMSRDLPNMSRLLVKRITTDPKVKLNEHWKFINVFIGGNDFCVDICYHHDPYKMLELYEKHLTETLRTFRDFLPRTIVNVVMALDLFSYGRTSPRSKICKMTLIAECPCLYGRYHQKDIHIYEDILNQWQKLQMEIVDRSEFNRQDFTVNLQKFSMDLEIPLNKNGKSDYTYLSSDCFHLSQKGNAAAATNLWNSLFEPYDNKSLTWNPDYEDLRCPTDENKFIRTREN